MYKEAAHVTDAEAIRDNNPQSLYERATYTDLTHTLSLQCFAALHW